MLYSFDCCGSYGWTSRSGRWFQGNGFVSCSNGSSPSQRTLHPYQRVFGAGVASGSSTAPVQRQYIDRQTPQPGRTRHSVCAVPKVGGTGCGAHGVTRPTSSWPHAKKLLCRSNREASQDNCRSDTPQINPKTSVEADRRLRRLGLSSEPPALVCES